MKERINNIAVQLYNHNHMLKTILNQKIDRRNFRKKILSFEILTETDKIYKPKKFDRFTIVPNAIFRHKGISATATGLYCWLFSHDSKTEMTVQFICGHFKEGKDAINKRIKELIQICFQIVICITIQNVI